MFTTAHAVVAITIAHQTGDPVLGFALGVVSHLVFDAIPHGDRNLFKAESTADGRVHFTEGQGFFWKVAILEGLLAVAVCVAIWLSGLESFSLVWIPAFGGVLPDLLVGLGNRGWLPEKIWAWYDRFNLATHRIWFHDDLSVTRGMALQVSTFVIALGLLIWT